MEQSVKENLPFYHPVGREEDVFRHLYKNCLPLLLKGPTGSGKSRFIEYMAALMKRDLITVSCHEETSAVDLLGRYLVKGDETVWMDGPLTRGVRSGSIIYLDEIAEARPDVIVAIHSLTDHRRELYLDRLNEILKAPPEFMLVASFNPGYQSGIKELKPSTRQRFVTMNFEYPSEEIEIVILQKESGIDAQTAKKLVKLAGRIRKTVIAGMNETVSTRLLVDAAKLISDGLPPRLSCLVSIIEPLTDDRETVSAMEEFVSLIF